MDEVMNYDHLARRTYRRDSYETFLLDTGDGDYSFELDFMVFDLCDRHDFLTVYDGPDQSHPVIAHETGQRENFLVYGSQRYMFLEFNATRASSKEVTIPFQTMTNNDSYIESILVQSMLENKMDYAGFRARIWKRCNKPGYHTRLEKCIKSKICKCTHPGFEMTRNSRKCRPKSNTHHHQPSIRVH